jgi:hypothetical protein
MISGRVAQMGRGMLVEISNDLLEKFVTNLKGKLDTSVSAAAPPQEAVTAPTSESGTQVAALTDTAPTGGTSSGSEQYLNATSLLWRVLWRKLLRLFGLSRRG